MNAFSLGLVRKHLPQLRQPLAPRAWTVLVEHSDGESEAHATESLESLLGDALEQGLIEDTAIAASLEQANAMWHLRESIPIAQSMEGANVKHDIALPVSAIEEFVASTDAALAARRSRAFVWSTSAISATATCTTTSRARRDSTAQRSCSASRREINDLVYDAVVARGGSISAEHGIGALKREQLEARKSPVALDMMRAIKLALDPTGVLNPGRVLRSPPRP